ncbi:MAG: heme NO-binding domain-containing protein [Burkholderiaceae bacterium]
MKGIVFREFIDMVESQFSTETADAIIQTSALSTNGAYTSVGTYPHQEMVDLVSNLSTHTGISVPDLLKHFGRHLFGRFVEIHPNMTNAFSDVFSLLSALENTIHVDVNKLYRDAETPSFTYERDGQQQMVFIYRSRRRMADFAQGLIEGCVAHFKENITIQRADLPSQGEEALMRFTLVRTANADA